jgi:hypothetical protein
LSILVIALSEVSVSAIFVYLLSYRETQNRRMTTPHLEISKYGIKRLRRISRYLKNGGMGYESLFGDQGWRMDYSLNTPKQVLVDRISQCGAFQFIYEKFQHSWETILVRLATDLSTLIGTCSLFGMDQDISKLSNSGANIEERMNVLQRIVNKLSVIYTFPGDPFHPVSRKRMNDIRLNALFKKKIFGREPLALAQGVTTFHDAVSDPSVREIFWSCYVPGTGLFNISFSNLEQLSAIEDCCSICMEEFTDTYPGIRLRPCTHIFHPRCIQQLILSIHERDVLCPLCRKTVEDLG